MNTVTKVARRTKIELLRKKVHGISWNLNGLKALNQEIADDKKHEAELIRNKLSIELARNHVIWTARRSNSFSDQIDALKKKRTSIRSNPIWISYLSRSNY